ncbi:efflux transporter outer membrane subunit [Pseudoxanthomonas wuyuanensis]
MNPITLPRAILLALAASCLAGCVSTGRYAAAPVMVPDGYGADADAPATTVQLPGESSTYPARDVREDAWWRGFGDERLDRMVDLALSRNDNLAAAGLTLRRARLEAGLSETELWPTASGSASGSGSRETSRSDDFKRSYSADVALSWQIDLWGKLRAQRDATRWEADATAQDLENTALALVGDICSAYWQLAYLNQSIATGEDNLQRLQKTLDLVQVQYEAGAVSGLEPREAKQNLQSQRAAQSQLQQQRAQVRNAIAVLLGGQRWPEGDEPMNLDAAISPALEQGMPAELLARRPDLRAAELRLRASLAQIKVTARSYYPALTLTGSLGGASSSLADVVSNPVATLGAGLTLPFLNFHQAQLNTRIAGTSYEIAASQFRTTLYTALAEVETALSAREQLAAQADAARSSYQAAQEIERRYEVRYRTGATDLRTWLDAQQTLRDSELAYAQVRLDQLDNDVILYQALGGGSEG